MGVASHEETKIKRTLGKQKLKELLEQTKVEIADELDSFIEKIDSSTDDPNNFLTMTELEKQWKELSLKTHKIYSDLVSKSLSSVESKELRISKKDNSSRKESG